MVLSTWVAIGILLGVVAVAVFALRDNRARWQRRGGPMQRLRDAQRPQRQEWAEFLKRQRAKAKTAKLKPS